MIKRNFASSFSSSSSSASLTAAAALSMLIAVQAALLFQEQQQYASSDEDDCHDKSRRNYYYYTQDEIGTDASSFSSFLSSLTEPLQQQIPSSLSSSMGWGTTTTTGSSWSNHNKPSILPSSSFSLSSSLLSSSFSSFSSLNRTAMEASSADSSGGGGGGGGMGGGYLFASAATKDGSSSSSSSPPTKVRIGSLARRSATVAGQLAQATEKGVTLETKFKVNWRRPLGEGTFGAVYAGTNRATGEPVAVKKISKSCTDQVTFQNEMQALLELKKHGGHPHICGLQAAFFNSDDGYYYLVLDLIAGGELFNHLCEQGPYSEADAARLVREVASAMNFMHGLGVVHGDLKPENLMLSTKEKASAVVKIVDFGCAQILPANKSSLQKKKSNRGLRGALAWASGYGTEEDDDGVEGEMPEIPFTPVRGAALTPAYSPPEVLQRKQEHRKLKEQQQKLQEEEEDDGETGKKKGSKKLKGAGGAGLLSGNGSVALDPSFDMWALGVILYILLTAVHPFDLTGNATDEEIEKAIISHQKPPVNSPLTAHLSKDAIAVIEQLLTWEPEKRLTAQQLLENPWVRGETARTQKIADSDKRLAAYRAFQTKLQAKAFADMVALSSGIGGSDEDETPTSSVANKASSNNATATAKAVASIQSKISSGTGGRKGTMPHSQNGGETQGTVLPPDDDNTQVAKRTSLIERAFQSFDPDHRGYIPAKELRKLVGDQQDVDGGLVGDLSLSGFSDILSEHMHNKYYPKGHVIYHEGDIGNAMFFLNSGTIEIFTKDGYRAVRQAGEFFGEGALLNPKKTRSASIRCLTPIHAIEISREYFEKYIATDQGVKLNLREKDKARKRQRAKMLLQLQKNMMEKTYKKGEFLFRKGETGAELFLVDEGKVMIKTGDQEIIAVEKGEMTGEHSFVFGRKRNVDAQCVAEEGCRVFVMKARDFYKLLDSHPAFKESIREICLRREFQKAFCAKTHQSFPRTESALREAFEFVDTGKNGAIELEEISSLLKDFDPTYSEKDIKDILDALDLDESGVVRWEEFQRIFGIADTSSKEKKNENGNGNSVFRKRKKWKR